MIADETKGFLIIYAKLASIFGSKTMLLLALTIFTVFSLACGSVNSMTQLSVISQRCKNPEQRDLGS